MTRNMIFGGALAGAVALIGISSLFSSDDDNDWDDGGDRYRVVVDGETIRTDGSIVIEGRGRHMVVVTDDGSITCGDDGSSVVIDREGRKSIEIICD